MKKFIFIHICVFICTFLCIHLAHAADVIDKGSHWEFERITVSSHTITTLITPAGTNYDSIVENVGSYNISLSSSSTGFTYQSTSTKTLKPNGYLSPEGRTNGGLYGLSTTGDVVIEVGILKE